jgi:hypothetical protein
MDGAQAESHVWYNFTLRGSFCLSSFENPMKADFSEGPAARFLCEYLPFSTAFVD